MTPHCKCGRYVSCDGKPCHCAPWWDRYAWAVWQWRVRAVRARSVDRAVRGLFMSGHGWGVNNQKGRVA